MKTTLTHFTDAGQQLDSLIDAFDKFERELTWFQTSLDNGDFQYGEAEEAVSSSYFTIRNLSNRIAEELKDAEQSLIDADECYEEETSDESEGD